MQTRPTVFLIGLSFAFMAILMLACLHGMGMSPWEFIQAISRYLQGATDIDSRIAGHARLPRVLVVALIGACLGLSGAVLQGVFRNPLADPGLIGTSAGATVAAAIGMVFGVTFWLPALAFLGALVAVGIAVLGASFAARRGQPHIGTLLLLGVAINALCFAIVGLMAYIADDANLRDIMLWNLGRLSQANWHTTLILLVGFVVALMLALPWRTALDKAALGDATAKSMGVSIGRMNAVLICAAALATAVSVAFVGIIAFVGLAAPHVVRLWGGASHRLVLNAAPLMGAVFCLMADVGAHMLPKLGVMPLGILTSLLGAPVLFWLLLRSPKA